MVRAFFAVFTHAFHVILTNDFTLAGRLTSISGLTPVTATAFIPLTFSGASRSPVSRLSISILYMFIWTILPTGALPILEKSKTIVAFLAEL